MLRIFVALVLSDAFKQALAEATAGLRAGRADLRWIKPDGMHLTLAFLGELDQAGLSLATEAARRTAAGGSAFVLEADGLLALPRRGAAKVLAARFSAGGNEAEALARCLEDELEALGRETGRPFRERERRAFKAHATLARSTRTAAVLTQEEMAAPVRARTTIETLGVFESRLDRSGARYGLLAEFPLRGTDIPGALLPHRNYT
ncbi:MAG: 2'-5' RNA ligase [Treponema sp. GWB1_62_6]|nr:MAG: 2'-5' RNA ligase [Treponema sp. GWB1_62_6]OHE67397.1 MAG: 2'-5' RNA ligase [Treponema sp. GWC1_61_84]OHE74713.1 MAG: 2'-5' RNA ligase [Treponema sp. RIFOXYC1_FULL_61_9]